MIFLTFDRGGAGNSSAYYGEEGTITGKDCPKGLYGTFCSVRKLSAFKFLCLHTNFAQIICSIRQLLLSNAQLDTLAGER